MYVTMQEFFKAFGKDLHDTPMIRKSATGFHESVVFKGGIMAKFMRGKHVGKPCVWLPDEAKYLNKVLGVQLFTADNSPNLIREPNNVNVILYSQKGDVSIMWTVPIVDKIVNKLYEGLNSRYKVGSYVGYTIMLTIKNIGNRQVLNDKGIYPEMTSIQMPPEDFKNRIIDDYGFIETALNTDFVNLLHGKLQYVYLGFDDNNHYYMNDLNEVIQLSFYRDDRVDEIRGKASLTVERLANDFESIRL